MTATITNLDLAQFTGSSEFYQHGFLPVVWTEGINHLAEQAGAFWLIDAVGSHQSKALLRRSNGFQVWQLRKLPDNARNAAELTCWSDTPGDGSSNLLARQLIEYTDFPFAALGDAFQWYAQWNGSSVTMMLKSEY